PHRALHAFPTRRSSDLRRDRAQTRAREVGAIPGVDRLVGFGEGQGWRFHQQTFLNNEAYTTREKVRVLAKSLSLSPDGEALRGLDRKSTRLNSSHVSIS